LLPISFAEAIRTLGEFSVMEMEEDRMITRRDLVFHLGAGAILAAFPVFAQQATRVRRVGYLGPGSLENDAPWLAAFRTGLAQLGWVEERDYLLDARFANSMSEAMPRLASELVATKPDVILVPADGGVLQLVERTRTIPIVFAQARNPVGLGLVASLRKPGGNVTGLTSMVTELGPKRLQLLKEAFPRVAIVGVLSDANPSTLDQFKEIEAAAKVLGIRAPLVELRSEMDIDAAFKRGAALGVQAYTVTQTTITINQRQAIIDHMIRARVPAIFPLNVFADSGGLLSYGISPTDNFRRAAGYVDKILKGAKPGDLPIEQPTKLEMVVNKKTAKTMKFSIPQAILLRADRVIE
jgi:putative ABC transport system substrate-binding protein